MLYFSDTARLEERFYIGFEKYLMLGRENGAETCIRTTERAISDWLPFNTRRNHSYIANTILFGYGTLRGALLYRFWKISHAGSWERGQNVPSHNNDAYNEYCKGSSFRRKHSYIANTIFFGYSTLRGALQYRFWKISHAWSGERGQNVYTHNRTCNCGLATL